MSLLHAYLCCPRCLRHDCHAFADILVDKAVTTDSAPVCACAVRMLAIRTPSSTFFQTSRIRFLSPNSNWPRRSSRTRPPTIPLPRNDSKQESYQSLRLGTRPSSTTLFSNLRIALFKPRETSTGARRDQMRSIHLPRRIRMVTDSYLRQRQQRTKEFVRCIVLRVERWFADSWYSTCSQIHFRFLIDRPVES
jgi:hypothetical protein